jgi:hypothetical protein
MLRSLLSLALTLVVTPNAHAQNTAVEGLRNDLATFRREFLDRDKSFSASERAEALKRTDQLEKELATISNGRFELELARIVALADNGHTNSPASLRSRRFTRIPIRFVPFGEDFYVLRARRDHADLLGARLVAIDGQPIASVRRAAHTLWGGTASFRDRSVSFAFESPEQLRFLGITTSPTVATYRFSLRNGQTVDRRVIADSADASREIWGAGRWLYPQPLDADGTEWRMLGTGATVPWVFQEATKVFRLRSDPDLDAVVVELRVNRDAPGNPIAPFLAQATAMIRERQPRNVVLDLRANGGGDLNTTRDFVQSLPTLVPGRIFVLTSPWTFSAAISSVGYLEQAGGDRVTIVGEMAGDRLEFWAEGRLARLPFTGAAMSYSTERHDYANGCKAFRDCHGSVVRAPISVRTFAPDIPAPWTIEAYVAGRDPGMDAIARALRAM